VHKQATFPSSTQLYRTSEVAQSIKTIHPLTKVALAWMDYINNLKGQVQGWKIQAQLIC